MTARDHNKLLGIFFLVYGGLSALLGIFIGVIYGGLGTLMLTSAPDDEAKTVGGVFLGLAVMIGLVILVASVFYFVTGWKIYKEARIGKMLGIIASILCLMNFPLGTALGIFGLWFLFSEQGKGFYEGQRPGDFSPPPPNSWQ